MPRNLLIFSPPPGTSDGGADDPSNLKTKYRFRKQKMKHIATIIASLWLAACEPYEPPGEGGTESSEPEKPTPPQNPPSDPPSKPEPDENGCLPTEDTCYCGIHHFRFSQPLPATLQFPNPLGAKDFEGNYIKAKLQCTGPNSNSLEIVDLSKIEPFFVDPSAKIIGGTTALPFDSETAAQYVQEQFGCNPISNDAGAATWKAVANQMVNNATNLCAAKLEEFGCSPGEEPVTGNGAIGIGAEDVCDAFLGWHLRDFLEQYTEKLEYDGIKTGAINTSAGATCAQFPVDESCAFGGSTG